MSANVHVKKIFRPKQNFWERIYLVELVRGLGVTLLEIWNAFFKPGHMPTFQYPEELRPIQPRFRGRHKLRKREDGSPVCVACYCCESVCPPKAISIVAEESPDPNVEKRPLDFRINMIRCIFCGMCVEACPKDAIYMTSEFELSRPTREELQFHLADLMEAQATKRRTP